MKPLFSRIIPITVLLLLIAFPAFPKETAVPEAGGGAPVAEVSGEEIPPAEVEEKVGEKVETPPSVEVLRTEDEEAEVSAPALETVAAEDAKSQAIQPTTMIGVVLTEDEEEAREAYIAEGLQQIIPLTVKNADLRKLLSGLAKVYGFNITLAPEVQGTVTVDFKGAKLIDAIDIILKDQGYGYQITGNIIRVTTQEKLRLEEEAEAQRQAAEAKSKKAEAEKRKAEEVAEPLISRVFNLNYVDAENVLKVIQPLLSPRGKAVVMSTRQFRGFEWETEATKTRQEKGIEEFSRSRTLVVQDTATAMRGIQKVIREVDKEPYQILIDAKILEVPLDQEFRLGINWTQALNQWQWTIGPERDEEGAIVSPMGKFGKTYTRTRRQDDDDTSKYDSSRDYDTTNDVTSDRESSYERTDSTLTQKESASLTSKATSSLDESLLNSYVNEIADQLDNLATSSQAYSAVINSTDFSLMLSAMRTNSNIVTLSNPRVIVHENYAAKIFVGKRFPIVSTEASDFGYLEASLESWEEIGILLKVIPQVRLIEGGELGINMIIHPEVSVQDGYAPIATGADSAYPIIQTRGSDTNVTIPDGDTVVIGGLISSKSTDEEDKIPLLGDIPILGYLFKEEHTALKKTNLLIFITAKIVDQMELSAYEKMMLEKSPPDALEDIRYVEDEDLRSYLYKSAKEPPPPEEEPEEEEEEASNEKGRKVTKAMKRSPNR